MHKDRSEIIERACERIAKGDKLEASKIIRSEYPFVPLSKSVRKYKKRETLKVFLRDGFIDRYRGNRLVFPPALRLLSTYLTDDFPYNKNGDMKKGHIAYWELFPTIDHKEPVAKGGADEEANWVCCSLMTNSIKSNWTLEELRWELGPTGCLKEWDGLIGWFMDQVQREPTLKQHRYMGSWYKLAMDSSLWPNGRISTR
ncbi:MAG: HNH endonuclease [Planctomycetota bacterium]|jgi:hypothetical protein